MNHITDALLKQIADGLMTDRDWQFWTGQLAVSPPVREAHPVELELIW